mmetsp:Transcript_3403/g.5005  ORF Transcript_3403/g.5005 Transcript_3403/m.5005 type:complete len:288 (+) Transcript_3403:71-934(+)
MSGFTFPSLASNSQATLICYRGPGCATQYTFDSTVLNPHPTVATLAEAQSQAFAEDRDICQGFFVDDLSETPFGDLTRTDDGGNYTAGFVNICTGNGASSERLTCNADNHIALVHLTGAEGSLRVESSVLQLISLEPFCWSSVQVVDGSCTWLGSLVECEGTSATLALITSNVQTCCGKLGANVVLSECVGTNDALNPDTCNNVGPPVGFESEPSCAHFTQQNSNIAMAAIPEGKTPSFLALASTKETCTRFAENVGRENGSTSSGRRIRLRFILFGTVAAALFSSI